MRRRVPKGRCSFCNAVVSKAGMTKHLKSCKQRRAALEASSRRRKSAKAKVFHIVVEGSDMPQSCQYWMHIEAPANATLEELDKFLRDVWVECCGHMSAFTIEGITYVSEKDVDLMWDSGYKGMDIALGKVLSVGLKFGYEYDFGTTTRLALRVVAEREGQVTGKPVRLLARNEPPLIKCEVCGRIATQVCSQCIWDDKGWLCDECASAHECGEEMLLPVVNSPRVGMCGYTGQRDDSC